jgi:hypothetical protein
MANGYTLEKKGVMWSLGQFSWSQKRIAADNLDDEQKSAKRFRKSDDINIAGSAVLAASTETEAVNEDDRLAAEIIEGLTKVTDALLKQEKAIRKFCEFDIRFIAVFAPGYVDFYNKFIEGAEGIGEENCFSLLDGLLDRREDVESELLSEVDFLKYLIDSLPIFARLKNVVLTLNKASSVFEIRITLTHKFLTVNRDLIAASFKPDFSKWVASHLPGQLALRLKAFSSELIKVLDSGEDTKREEDRIKNPNDYSIAFEPRTVFMDAICGIDPDKDEKLTVFLSAPGNIKVTSIIYKHLPLLEQVAGVWNKVANESKPVVVNCSRTLFLSSPVYRPVAGQVKPIQADSKASLELRK